MTQQEDNMPQEGKKPIHGAVSTYLVKEERRLTSKTTLKIPLMHISGDFNTSSRRRSFSLFLNKCRSVNVKPRVPMEIPEIRDFHKNQELNQEYIRTRVV